MPLKLCQVATNYCDDHDDHDADDDNDNDHDDNDADDEDDGINIAAYYIGSLWVIHVLILWRHQISVSGKLVAGIDF